MQKLRINKLGPIQQCEIDIDDFMVFTGPQASGKSTVAKSIFFFKNIRNILYTQIRKKYLLQNEDMGLSIKNRLHREIRSNFLQTFGSTWCMDPSMFIEFSYTPSIHIKVSLKKDPISPNYIWIEYSPALSGFLNELDLILQKANPIDTVGLLDFLKDKINQFFDEDSQVVYIPAGRSMITLLSTQLNYLYSSMDDTQKRSLDYCTQNYLERILQLKPSFSTGPEQMIQDKITLTDTKIHKDILLLASGLVRSILQGEYRSIDGEERLLVTDDRYVKINFASSGQQECVWILNVLFYYLLNHIKTCFIIEEPESHLFPNAQKLIAEFISLAKCNENQILLTTHSPYILGTVNNLLYAHRISESVDKRELSQIIHKNMWLDFSSFSAYFLTDGLVSSCTDPEFEAIENEVIDGVSEDINSDFEKMLMLKQKYNPEGV